ncbi:MAG: phosphoribosylanthranilate isomerase [Lachnospiraceae bacterium]|nr:phosphoribosylanthranilate isomerase [Lachnospiraceae bacterium]
MTKIKCCGMMRMEDITAANALKPDYVGYILAPGRKRTITHYRAASFTGALDPGIIPVGVFVDEEPQIVAGLLNTGVIRIAQLHGNEDEAYIRELRTMTKEPIWKAFRIQSAEDVQRAQDSSADMVLLDSGTGSGRAFNWDLLQGFERAYMLAGGLDPENIEDAINSLQPYGVDVSSGIETEGQKDAAKMTAFLKAVRGE